MEYFNEDELRTFLSTLGKNPHTLVCLFEPICHTHNLYECIESKVYGSEHSFSHNHRYLLEEAGFNIDFYEDILISAHRYVTIIAKLRH